MNRRHVHVAAGQLSIFGQAEPPAVATEQRLPPPKPSITPTPAKAPEPRAKRRPVSELMQAKRGYARLRRSDEPASIPCTYCRMPASTHCGENCLTPRC